MADTPAPKTAVPANQVGLVQNNRGSTAGFQKGQSGNPGGRPKGGVAAYVRTLAGEDGKAIVDKVWDIMQNPVGRPYQRQKTVLECAFWFADRGWGKAVAIVEHSGDINHSLEILRSFSIADLEAMLVEGKARQADQLAIQASAEVIADVDESSK